MKNLRKKLFFCDRQEVRIRWIFLFFLILLPFCTMAEQLEISMTSRYLPTSKLVTIEDIADLTEQAFSDPITQETSIRFKNEIIWLRIELNNLSKQPQTSWVTLGDTRTSFVTLYQQDEQDLRWHAIKNGLLVPQSQRPVMNRSVVFSFQLNPSEKRVVYFSLFNHHPIGLHPQCWSPEIFENQQRKQEKSDLIVFGGAFTLAIFCLLHAIAARDTALFLNSLRLVISGIWSALVMGYVTFYYLPEVPVFLPIVSGLLPAISLMVQKMIVLSFLPSQNYPRWIRYSFYGVIIIVILELIICSLSPSFLDKTFKFNMFVGAATLLPTIYACFISAWRGFKPAWWLLLSYGSAFLGISSKVYEALGLSISHEFMDVIGLVNVLDSTLFFYIGTTARLDYLQTKKKQALQQVITLQQETELRLEKEVKQRTAELETVRDEANEANQAKTVFLAKVSHELRSPLHTILGYTNLMQRDGNLQHLNTIHDAGQHLLDLIDDLLVFVQHSRETFLLNVQPIFSQRLIEQLQAHGETLAKRNHNQFLCHIDKTFPTCIEIDSRRVIQIGIALLTNAANYTQYGRIELYLNCVGENKNELELCVIDNGVGINAADLKVIFQPFERGKMTNTTKAGLGLGLTIAVQLAKAMGGDLQAQSEPQKGSIFTLCLPFVEADASSIAPFKTTELTVCGYEGKSRRILVVEDNDDHRYFMMESLETLGFDVVLAASLSEALGYAIAHADCDLVLLDFNLGDATGHDVLGELRKITGWENVPVVLISASLVENTAGFATVLTKPVKQNDLLGVMAQLLNLIWRRKTVKSIENDVQTDWETALNEGDIFAIEAGIDALKLKNPELAGQLHACLLRYDFVAIKELLQRGNPAVRRYSRGVRPKCSRNAFENAAAEV